MSPSFRPEWTKMWTLERARRTRARPSLPQGPRPGGAPLLSRRRPAGARPAPASGSFPVPSPPGSPPPVSRPRRRRRVSIASASFRARSRERFPALPGGLLGGLDEERAFLLPGIPDDGGGFILGLADQIQDGFRVDGSFRIVHVISWRKQGIIAHRPFQRKRAQSRNASCM